MMKEIKFNKQVDVRKIGLAEMRNGAGRVIDFIVFDDKIAVVQRRDTEDVIMMSRTRYERLMNYLKLGRHRIVFHTEVTEEILNQMDKDMSINLDVESHISLKDIRI